MSKPSIILEPPKTYIAQIEVTNQVTEDEWRRYTLTILLQRDTTVEQIVAWAKEKEADVRYGITIREGEYFPPK